ncbi:MAG: DUF2608 domain-containing protein [Verrucomicrobia bacterium]|nr:DUF2608 domain-containing protein [Verrucomicrobiota bacterium]
MSVSGVIAASNETYYVTNNIEDILKEVEEGSALFLDQDDTQTNSPLMIGTGAGRQYMREQLAGDYDLKSPENPHDMITYRIASELPAKAVELALAPLIGKLQDDDIASFCLTSRGFRKWYSTIIEKINELSERQFKSIGIDFSRTKIPGSFDKLDASTFYNGIFLTNGIKKATFLRDVFLKTGYLPSKVIFVDDKEDEVKAMKQMLDSMGIRNACFVYTRAANECKEFNPVAAAIQLEAFYEGKVIPSEEEAKAAAKEMAVDDPNEYFKQIIRTYYPVKV